MLRCTKLLMALLAIVAPPVQAREAADATAIRAHAAYLASDELAGRDPGTDGYDKAAAYVADQFRAAGLVPVAGWRDFFQPVTLQKRSLKPDGVDFTLTVAGRPIRLQNGVDIALDPGRHAEIEMVSAPVVFAGYGISAPHIGHDDFARLDVKGKAVAIFEGAPATLPPTLRAHYAWSVTKEEMALKHGAVALLTIKTPARERISPWARAKVGRLLPGQSWIGKDGKPQPGLPVVTLGPDAVDALFAQHGGSAALFAREAAGTAVSTPLDASVRFERRSQHEIIESANVIAVLPGTDPAHSNHYVMVTAHLDHVGIGPAVDGDAIHNGLVDNAGGVAVMLEAARRIAQAGGTKRSLLFVATTAEEKGLLGAYYLTANPVIPLDRIDALVNIDGLPLFHDYADIIALGAESSTMEIDVRAAASANGATLAPDPQPDRGNLALSDQYPFLRQGIPVLFANPGVAPGRDGSDGKARLEAFMANRYHRPSDDITVPVLWDQAARWADFHIDVVTRIANRADKIQWYEDDPLGAMFAPNAPKALR